MVRNGYITALADSYNDYIWYTQQQSLNCNWPTTVRHMVNYISGDSLLPYPPMTDIWRVFSVNVWLTILTAFIVMITIGSLHDKIIRKGDHMSFFRNAWIFMKASMLIGERTLGHSNWLYILWLISIMPLAYIMQNDLTAQMTNRPVKHMNNIDDLVADNRYNIYVDTLVNELANASATDTLYDRFNLARAIEWGNRIVTLHLAEPNVLALLSTLCYGPQLYAYVDQVDLIRKLPADKKQFYTLNFYDLSIDELPANVFGGLQFEQIYIQGSTALTRVHRLAFNGTDTYSTKLYIVGSPLTDTMDKDWDLFGAIHKLPVSGHQNLSEVYIIWNPRLKSIAAHAFDELPALKQLFLSNNAIQSVGGHAFAVAGNHSDDQLVQIYLDSNSLTSDSFGVGALAATIPVSGGYHINYYSNNLAVSQRRMLSTGEIQPLYVPEPGYNLFEAIRATTTLISIQIYGSNLTKVPRDAFRSHPNIVNIDMANNPIAAIEPHAFDNTTMLQYMVFSNDHLATLPADAFNVGEEKYREIEVHLEGNNLNKVNLTGATFAHINGYVNLYLYNNGFQYLNETVFTAFLLSKPHNKIYSDTDCKHKAFLFVLTALINCVVGNNSACPDTPIRPPCKYIDGGTYCDIECKGPAFITKILTDLNSRLPIGQKLFRKLYLSNTQIEELPAKAFGGIQFSEINIQELYQLRRVNIDAFDGTALSITTLFISWTPVTEVATNGSDLFAAIDMLKYLESLYLGATNVTTLPSMSVSGLRNLRYIYFNHNPLKYVDANAFNNLHSLSLLEFTESPAQRVAAYAFTIGQNTTAQALRIDFSPQPNDPFDIRSLESIGCATTLSLGKGSMKYLNRIEFETFFSANVKNTVFDVDIDCADSRNQWIVQKYPHVWKDLKCSTI
ncbi:unnamed protein product [Medioppia subpectinata]|uniref:Uncharacterized protein n=1 Tax=Medioppia subpectinata TaxID=1979941 RepID=A0A7R9KHT4_9ACAR|nr:unnamed protein product [Medioppia subpectinata]CAG2102565.1 unnamed protein product [Medioppia subpectinata]